MVAKNPFRPPGGHESAPKGYRGFDSKAAYETHYSDERNYADEIPAMEAYNAECQEHIASVYCWCRPVRDEDEPTVWIHSDSVRHTDTDTEMWDYQPSPNAVTQGDDCQ